jgi:radical SAM superfamily enzyme YgiQ (UPF0313 family)
VALVYPNPYRVAMSSLGYQVIYRMMNEHPDVVCERAVLPDDVGNHRRGRLPMVTLETGRPVGGADCIAVSLAYEPDIACLFDVLDLASVPILREDRDESHPPVILGGPITMSNALPLAPVADAIVIGDGEPVITALLEALVSAHNIRDRGRLLDELATLPGVFVPARHGTAVPDMLLSPASDLPAIGQIWTPDAELSDMMLVEASRGCPRFCSFCVMRSTAQPMRESPFDPLLAAMDTPAPRIGFVGAAVSEYSHIRPALRAAVAAGKGVGISSLRADRLDEEFVGLLHAGGYRTMTVASDAPSQALRGKLKKGLRGRHLIRAAELAADVGMRVFKMYVIIGLPGETKEDLDELVEFSLGLQKIIGRVAIGASPFVPKLHTPLGDAEFTPIKTQERRIKYLRNQLKGRVEIRSVSPRWAWIEYRLSQGGIETGLAAYEAWKKGGRFADYKRAFEALDGSERSALKLARDHGLWAPAGMR